MRASTKKEIIIVSCVASILVLGLGAWSVLSRYDIIFQPKQPTEIACTLEARICPDGSSVGRLPPSCEFAPCESPIDPGGIAPSDPIENGGKGTVGSPQPGISHLAQIPDLTVSGKLISPMTVKYVVEHRSALNGKTITVTGYVVTNYLKQPTCDQGQPCPAMFMLPQIVLADSPGDTRNKDYDLSYAFLNDQGKVEDSYYPVGQITTVIGIVEGSRDDIRMSTPVPQAQTN